MRDLILTLVTLLGSLSLSAQEGHIVDKILPQVYEAGSSVKVHIEGFFLEDPQEVIFYDKGFKATDFKQAKSLQTLGEARYSNRYKDSGQNLEMTIHVHPKVKPGEYFFRLRTKTELSPMLSFWVTQYPVVEEKHVDKDKRNDSAESAQEVSLNSTVTGYINEIAHQDHDWYKVKLKKGQRLSIHALAMRLATQHYGGMNDTALEVFDADMKKVAANKDNSLTLQDPYVSLKAEKDGYYYIHMFQQMDYETGIRHYALHIGDFSRPSLTYPLGGQAGKAAELTIYDDAVGTYKKKFTFTKSPGQFEESYQFLNQEKTPSPNRLHVAHFPDVMEKPGDKTEEKPQVLAQALPVAINGRIESEGEVDCYKFKAEKGKKYRVRVYARTLGSELDSKYGLSQLRRMEMFPF